MEIVYQIGASEANLSTYNTSSLSNTGMLDTVYLNVGECNKHNTSEEFVN